MFSKKLRVIHTTTTAGRLALGKTFFEPFGFNIPHGDPFDDALCKLPSGELEILKANLISGLIEQKILRKLRFIGKFYLVAFDRKGMHTFDEKQCEHCLTKTSKKEELLISIMSWMQKM